MAVAPENPITREADLIASALCREIASAARWSDAVDAWQALVHVRQMQKSLTAEKNFLSLGTPLPNTPMTGGIA